jgi:hypothetical protein
MFRSDAAMDRRRLLALVVALAIVPLGAAQAEEKKKKSGGESYLPLDTLTATTIKANGHRGVLTVECGLDVPDPKLREYAALSLPRLRAAYVQTVMTYAAGLVSGAPPNPDFLARDLQRQTDIVLGRPGARLLLGAVMSN